MKSVLLFVLFVYNFLTISGNTSDFILSRISPPGGLSSESINAIVQDKNDFIWIGTNHGLLKYNNQNINHFIDISEENPCIQQGIIHSLAVDHDGAVWVATFNRLCVLNMKTQLFNPFTYNKEDSTGNHPRINHITNDRNGNIWIADNQSIGVIDKENASLQRFPLENNDTPSYLFCDKNNLIWIGTIQGNVYQFNPNKQTLNKFAHTPGQAVSSIFRHQNKVWIGYTKYGLQQYSLDGLKEKDYNFNLAMGSDQKNWTIRKVLLDSDGTLWISTYHGLFVQSPKGELTWLNSNKTKGLPHSSTFAIFEDRQKGIWIGTWAGGISYYHKANNQFINYSHSNEPNSITNNVVSSFVQDQKGRIYVGTERGGLNLFHKQKGTFSPVAIDDTKTDFSIKHQCIDKKGGHWIATKDHGLWYKPNDKTTYQQFKAGPENGKHISGHDVYSVFPVDTGVWIGTHGNDANFYHYQTKKIKFQPSLFGKERFNKSPYIKALIVDSRSNLWIGTVEDLKCIGLKTNNKDTQAGKGINRYIYTIKEIKNGQIWIGTKNGLIIYDPKTDTFSDFKAGGLLKEKSVYGIQQDHNQHIWITSNDGLIHYKPEFETTKRYTPSDGIQGLWFNPKAVFMDRDSLLYFGGTNGFTMVSPDKIKINTRPPKVVINQITINNEQKRYPFYSSTDSSIPELTLNHQETTLRFDFTSDNFLLPEKNRFQYRLINYYDEWIEAGQEATALFANLKWGTYVFEVRGSNNDDIWCQQPARLSFTISKPIYATHTAYFIYFIIFSSTLFFLIRILKARSKLKNDILIQNLQHKQEEQLNELKLKFFTNVSHEFKTPLSLISGPAKNLMLADNLNEEQKSMLDIIQRNSKRLLMLVNQIIDFRKIDKGKEKLNLSSANIVSFLKERMLHFTFEAESKSILFVQSLPDEPMQAEFDPEKLDYIIFNLLSNSFKFTPHGKKISLTLAAGKQQPDQHLYQHHISFGEINSDDILSIFIEDQGTGIDAEDLERVFNRFEQGKTPVRNSSGIGLSLCRDFTLLHKGQLHVYSTPEKGSCFVVQLPIRQEGENTYFESQTLTFKLEDTATPIPTPEKQKRMVLIVEDNPDLRTYISSILKPLYHIKTAENGKIGLEILQTTSVDIIISDVMMPEMNGFEFCAKVKSDMATSHLPLILLTALSSTDNQIEGMQHGADAYISKPFSDNLLLSQITNLLTQRVNLRKHFGSKIPSSESVEMNSLDNYFLKKLNVIIEEHLNDEKFDIEQLTTSIGISRSQLHRKLKSLTNYSTSEYIRVYRLEKAIELLKTGQYNIDEVAHVVGFNTHSYFSRCFKKHYNQSPKEYMAKLKTNNDQM